MIQAVLARIYQDHPPRTPRHAAVRHQDAHCRVERGAECGPVGQVAPALLPPAVAAAARARLRNPRRRASGPAPQTATLSPLATSPSSQPYQAVERMSPWVCVGEWVRNGWARGRLAGPAQPGAMPPCSEPPSPTQAPGPVPGPSDLQHTRNTSFSSGSSGGTLRQAVSAAAGQQQRSRAGWRRLDQPSGKPALLAREPCSGTRLITVRSSPSGTRRYSACPPG